jgi:glycosyltransferase involved in cell wall biosynthesis
MTGNRPALSAVVITRDAGRHLADTLASLAFCTERLVLDSGSTDDTLAIAHAAGARVEHQPFLGYGPQKRRAVDLAAHDWILSLDADETLDEEATTAIQALDLADPRACYAFRRRTFVGQREVRHGPWGGETVVRLFHRRHAEFSPLLVHEQVEAPTAPRLLPGSILHHSFTDCADVIARSVHYARLKAGIMRAKGQRVSPWTLPARGASNFLKSYVLQGGWRDGPVGFVIAISRVIDSTLPRALVLLDETDTAS